MITVNKPVDIFYRTFFDAERAVRDRYIYYHLSHPVINGDSRYNAIKFCIINGMKKYEIG
jgi:hypothetical protein